MTLHTARRLLTYLSAFVALFAVLIAVSGLLSLLTSTPSDPGDFRDALSRYLATLILALPALWLAWTSAGRRARESWAERHSTERRCFLASVFAGAGLTALYSCSTMLQEVLTRPDLGGQQARAAAIRLLVYGMAWLIFARVEWRERSPGEHNPPHDAAVFLLAGCSLDLLLSGLIRAVHELIILLTQVGASGHMLMPTLDRWTWGPIAGLILTGGPCWGAIWRYDLRRGGRRTLRVIYLYLVLTVCAFVTLSHGLVGLYEAIRRLLGYPGAWEFLRWALPGALVCGPAWAYHWTVLRRQRVVGEEALPRGISSACRLGITALCWLGLGLAALGAISLIWLALEALLVPGNHPAPGWWRDWASAGLAFLLVGLACWSGAWRVLQRAARECPRVERTATERRILLGAVTVTTGLPAAGYAIAALWLILRTALGGELNLDVICRVAQYGCAAASLVTLAVAHASLLRSDLLYGDAIAKEPPDGQEPSA